MSNATKADQQYSRSELKTAVALKREKIGRELLALKEELTHLPIRRYIREHPLQAVAGAAVLGYGVSRWISSKLKSGMVERHQQQLVDELVTVVIEDAAEAVAAGAESKEALRAAVRSHAPIILETPKEKETQQTHKILAAAQGLFAIAQPMLTELLETKRPNGQSL